MPKATWFFASLLILAGCASRDPFAGSYELLAPGSEALIVYDTTYGAAHPPGPDAVRVRLPSGREIGSLSFVDVPVAIKVRVVEDPPAKADEDKFKRPVKVLILEGQYNGEVCTIPREHLRPATK